MSSSGHPPKDDIQHQIASKTHRLKALSEAHEQCLREIKVREQQFIRDHPESIDGPPVKIRESELRLRQEIIAVEKELKSLEDQLRLAVSS